MTAAQPVRFVPAYAERFCAHCGFPFRDPGRNDLYCHVYGAPRHGRCGQRLRDAQDPDGLEKRLRATQQADPYAQRTSEDAIAHGWVRQHYPHVDLELWRPNGEPDRHHIAEGVTLSANSARTFILTWNPRHFRWENHGYHDAIQHTADGQMVPDDWTVGNRTGGISSGDRAYLYRQHDNRGIVASGAFTSGVQTRQHWDDSGRTAQYADVNWCIVLDYEDRLPLEVLTREVPEMPWSHLQGSGIEVKPVAVPKLLDLWQRHTNGTVFRLPDEPRGPEMQVFPEGAVSRVEVNRYERDQRARKACLRYWGYVCAVCDFSFEKFYGSLGKEYIHVHHVKELSRLPADYHIDPIADLRPVCPNCHAMIHRGAGEALSVDELKRQLRRPE